MTEPQKEGLSDMTIEHEIAALEQRARNGRQMADQCKFEARECEARAQELRRELASKKKVK